MGLSKLMMLKHLALALLAVVQAQAFRGHLRHQPPPPSRDNAPAEQYFDQVLDHYNAIDGRTWPQRFWEKLDHYVEGGPAFIFIGGEGEASPGWLNYGQSKPTEDMSTENMRYLSSRQGLEDLGHFMTAMNAKYDLSTWITFGGSYPGSLSAWVNLRFPHLVGGSVSSS